MQGVFLFLLFVFATRAQNSNNGTTSSSGSAGSMSVSTTTVSGEIEVDEDEDNLSVPGTSTVAAAVTNQVNTNLTRSYFAIPINDGQVTPFTVGALIPLSINGTASTIGVQMAEAFKCSLNAANNNRGIIRNISLLYSIQDSNLNQNDAFSQALLLERRGTFAVVGPMNNVQVVPVANLYNTANTPMVSYGAGSFNLGNSTTFPTFMRVWPPDTSQGRAMAETFRLLGWTFIAALFTNDEYGQSGRLSLLQATSRQRIRVTCVNSIFPNSTQGLQSFSDCVANSDAAVVVLWMGPESAAAVISTMYSNPLNNRTTFVASNEWAFVTNVNAFVEQGRRVTGLTFPPDFLQGSLGFHPMLGSTALVRACFSQVNPSNTNYTQFTQVWERFFSCTATDDDTMSLCPEKLGDRRAACRCRGDEDFNAIPLPPNINYIYDAATVYSNALNFITNPQQCVKIIGGDYCNLTELTSAQLLNAAIQASFKGLTGDVNFNQTNPDRRRSYFDVYQHNVTDEAVGDVQAAARVLKPNQVGFWNISGVYLSSSALYWKTGDEVPLSVIVPQNTQVDDYLGAVFVIILAIILIIVCLVMMIFFFVYRRTKVVKMANIWFIQTILLGAVLVLVSIILWSVYQTKTICTIKSALGMLGFGLIIGCLLAKGVRYFLIYINYGRPSPKMTNKELLIPLGVVMFFNFILMIIYILPGGLPNRIITQSASDTTYLYITCSTDNPDYGDMVIYFFLGYNLIMVLIAFMLMLMARSMKTPYNEGSFIIFVLADILILNAVLIPIYYTTGDRRGSVQQQYLIRSLGCLFGITFTVIALFAPKIIAVSRILKGEDDEGDESKKAVLYGMTEEASSDESVGAGEGGVQFFSDNIIRRSQTSTDSEMVRRPSGTGSSIGE